MKRIIFLITLGALLSFTATAFQQKTTPAKKDTVKKDTVKDLTKAPKPKVVKGKAARRRLQLQQIKYHDKQQKKIDSLDKVIQKDTQKTGHPVK
jgi:hypothetical protein